MTDDYFLSSLLPPAGILFVLLMLSVAPGVV